MSKTIMLKQLTLRNFKGIKDLSIDFSHITDICGDNATGKTTVFDAFMWLLFDKDSHDKSKFDVQPLNENNNVIHMLETDVTATLEVDGISTVLKKVLKEKWVKPKGKPQSELKGITTTYYIDDVPKKQGEYKEAINSTIQEDIFKLLTNPMYFSTNLKWQDRKKVLMDIIGDFSDNDVIDSKKELSPLRELLSNKNIDELKKSIAASKKRLVKDKESIPDRVDELNRTVRKDIDFGSLESKKNVTLSRIKNVEDQLLDSSKADENMLKEKNKLYELKDKLKDIEYQAKRNAEKPLMELKDKLFEFNNNKTQIDRKIKGIEAEMDYKKSDIEKLNKEMDQLRKKYADIQNEDLHFDENMFICPTCKRPFEASDVEAKKQEMTENFRLDKAEKLKKINKAGCSKKDQVQKLDLGIQEFTNKLNELNVHESKITANITEINEKIEKFKPDLKLESNLECQKLKKQIEQLEDKLSQPVEHNLQIQELKNKKALLQNELSEVEHDLNYKEINKQTTVRITELQNKEKELAQQIADLENQEFMCEDFIKTKVKLLESSINSKFKYVKFRFFKQQVNGGIDEDCEPIVNGIPFNTNLNNAAKVNAGLDIINTLSQHYGISAPIFIDNKESVTKLIETGSQIINLIVSKSDKNLRIESEG